jgi:hypothetical protein
VLSRPDRDSGSDLKSPCDRLEVYKSAIREGVEDNSLLFIRLYMANRLRHFYLNTSGNTIDI